jgi:hypothetical protein
MLFNEILSFHECSYSEIKKRLLSDKSLNITIEEKENISLICFSSREKDANFSYYKRLKNYCIDTNTLEILCIQYSNILYNEDVIQLINNHNWKNIVAYQSYDGINFTAFFTDNLWYIIYNNGLFLLNGESDDSSFKSIQKALTDIINLDELDKKNYYDFELLPHKKNIVRHYDDCVELIHKISHEKITNKQIEFNIENTIKQQQQFFSCLDELIVRLDKISFDNVISKKITIEGFILYIYDPNDTSHTHGHKVNADISSAYVVGKIQSDTYKKISKLKQSLTGNIYQNYLELYQNGKLVDYLPYFSKYTNEIVHRINMSMKTLSREILNIYHATRKKKNKDLYDILTEQYKKILYSIHGLYINIRKTDFINGHEIDERESKSITVHDVYYYLKSLPPDQLRQLYHDRLDMLENPSVHQYLCKDCIFTITQSKLMEHCS